MAQHRSADSFKVELRKRLADVVTVTDQQARAIGLEMFKRVILKTPVDTGYARGNWQTTVGQPAPGLIPRNGADAALNEATAVFGSTRLTSNRIYLSNHVPYITVLEYGGFPNPPKRGTGKTVGGFSTQAPQGMVGVTLAEFEQVAKFAIESVRAPK